MNTTILLATLTLEIGLAAGYALAWWERFIQEGRAMYQAMARAISNRSLP
jgi:hypothetical protein